MAIPCHQHLAAQIEINVLLINSGQYLPCLCFCVTLFSLTIALRFHFSNMYTWQKWSAEQNYCCLSELHLTNGKWRHVIYCLYFHVFGLEPVWKWNCNLCLRKTQLQLVSNFIFHWVQTANRYFLKLRLYSFFLVYMKKILPFFTAIESRFLSMTRE